MNFTEQMDFINHLEDLFEVEKWVIDDIHIWPLLRVQLGVQLSIDEFGYERSGNNQKLDRLKELAKGNINYLINNILDNKNNQKPCSNYDVVFLGDQVSRVSVGTKWYDRLCDPFIDCLNRVDIKCFHLEPFHNYKTPRYSPGFFVQPHLDFLTLRSLLTKSTTIPDDHFINEYQEFLTLLLQKSKISFYDINLLTMVIFRLRLYANWFKKILLKLRPKIGFVVCYYGLEGMAFNLACKELGIPSVDIQHGVQGDMHFAYGRWKRIPLNGYELLPTFYWVWTEHEASVIDKWNSKEAPIHKPVTGGNPWLWAWQDNKTLFANGKQIPFPLESYSKVILFTLQPYYAEYGLSPWILEAINQSPPDWLWLVRLHPTMHFQRESIKKVLRDYNNVEVDFATDVLLPELLNCVDIHITHSSSTVIEAQCYGIPNIVLNEMGKEFYLDQVIANRIKLAVNTKELLELIKTTDIDNNKAANIVNFEDNLYRLINNLKPGEPI